MSGNGLAEGIVFRAKTISRVKTYNLGSGDDDVCVLFLSWRRHFLEKFLWFGCSSYDELTSVAGPFFYLLLLCLFLFLVVSICNVFWIFGWCRG
jgi:hypothetical protein